MRTLGIIPARYGSTRFPGKPLAIIEGKPMIQRVYERAITAKSLDQVVIATDDQRIVEAAERFNGKVVMTSSLHQTGTDRCCEVLDKSKEDYEIVINIQGDEPFIDPTQIDQLSAIFKRSETEIATLIKAVSNNKELFDRNKPKVVVEQSGKAIYFSRAAIPHQLTVPESDWLKKAPYWKHIGIYGYRSDVLKAITKLKQSPLELAERLEQLRWLENGYTIMTAETKTEAFSVDTPEDIQALLKKIRP